MTLTTIHGFGVIYTETKEEGQKIVDELNRRRSSRRKNKYISFQSEVAITTYEKFFVEE